MTFENSRQQTRRQINRRITERRGLNNQFMSNDWLEQIQNNDLSWPKQDRRLGNRRLSLRRNNPSHRISNIHKRNLSTLISSNSKTMTAGEKQMLIDIMNQSISD